MHPRFRASAGYLRRFHNEARSAAQLHHTNIVSVFDYGEHDGVCYYAMQYIAGHSLDQILADVRRLRSNQGQEKAAPVEAGPDPNTKAHPAPPQAVHDAAQTEAAADPLMRTVTHGLLTGQFAKGAGVALDLEGTPPPATEPIAPGMGSRTAMTHDLGFELGRTQAPAPPSTRDEDRNHPDSASGLSSSSLAGQGEDRYHREVARFGAQVADALAYAHKRGVLHRDIKPSNLLLDAVGNVWVTDFGLAKFEEGEDLSQSQDLVGTLRYMAPERFRGVSDRRCDIYALGATLYELLTLRPVFESADRLRLIDQIVHEPPAPPRQLDRRIPRDLETIVLKALAKDPKDRFATADELAAELRRFLENRPIRSRPISASERLWRWCKRNPGLAALNALAATLTTIIAIVSTVAAWTYHGQRNELRFEQGRTKASLSRAEHAEHEARLALGPVAGLRGSGTPAHRADRPAVRQPGPARPGRAGPGSRPRGPEATARDPQPCHRRPGSDRPPRAPANTICGDVFGINVDAALERYAVVERSGAVVVRRLDDDRELVRLPGPDQREFLVCLACLQPGRRAAGGRLRPGGGGNLLRVWHLGRRELLGSLPSRGRPAVPPRRPPPAVRCAGGGHRRLGPASSAGWSGGCRWISRRTIWRSIPRAGGSPSTTPMQAAPRVAILELETGRVLATGGRRSATVLWPGAPMDSCWRSAAMGMTPASTSGTSAAGRWPRYFRDTPTQIIGAQFAHSGYLLATASWDGTTRLWDAASGEPLAIAPGDLLGSFAPDDRRLAFRSGGKIGVWDVAAGTGVPDAPPRHARQPLRGAGRDRGARRLTSAPTAGWWRPATGTASASGRPTRAANWPISRPVSARPCCFTPTGRASSARADGACIAGRSGPIPSAGRTQSASVHPSCCGKPRTAEWNKATWLPDHRTLALIDNANARVLLIDSSHPHPAWSRATALDSGENRRMTTVAVSPDGRWLAVGGWYEAGVRVWDLRRRRLERILRPKDAVSDTKFFIGFSPDGRWLVSCTHPDAGQAFTTSGAWGRGTWSSDRPGAQRDRRRSRRRSPATAG